MRSVSQLPAPQYLGLWLLVVGCLLASSLVGQQIGVNDFRISFQGGTGSFDPDAFHADSAYDPINDRFLVVWSGEGGPDRPDDAAEIWARLLNGYGVALGPAVRISDAGASSNNYQALEPTVVFNSIDQEFLVVWSGNCFCPPLGTFEYEIFGQLLDTNGAEIGTDDFRISETGGTGPLGNPAREPKVAFNSIENEYLVVWRAREDLGAPDNSEDEIYGQLLDSSGSQIGIDFRISDAGGSGDDDFFVERPAIAFAEVTNEYLVVWSAEDDAAGLTQNELEIFGQRITSTGAEIGPNDFLVSLQGGGVGDQTYDAREPSVAWNDLDQEFLVAWVGDELPGQDEVFIQRLAADGSELDGDVQISDRPEFEPYFASRPDVAFDSLSGEYLVVWSGEVGNAGPVEFEVYGQYLSRAGIEVGPDDLRLSDLGTDGDNAFDAARPRVAVRTGVPEFLVVWDGDDDQGGLVDAEQEIFGQRLGYSATLFSDGFESGDLGAWAEAP